MNKVDPVNTVYQVRAEYPGVLQDSKFRDVISAVYSPSTIYSSLQAAQIAVKKEVQAVFENEESPPDALFKWITIEEGIWELEIEELEFKGIIYRTEVQS